MAPRIPAAPRDAEEKYDVASSIIGAAASVLPANVVTDLRKALERADDTADLDDVELHTNLDAARRRVLEGLTTGTLNADEARRQLADARARAEVDQDLGDLLRQARGGRRGRVWSKVTAVNWEVVRTAGKDAAGRFAELAAALPVGAAIDPTAKDHAKLVAAADQWLAATSTLVELRRWGVLDYEPLTLDEFTGVSMHEWRWGGALGALAIPSNMTSSNPYEAFVTAVHAGAKPACCDPADISARLDHRGKLVDYAQSFYRAGYTELPGVDLPLDMFAQLPTPARQLLSTDWPKVVSTRAA